MGETVYIYDGSFAGLLCCIFESYSRKEIPAAIVPSDDAPLTLFPLRSIAADPARARQVLCKIRRLSPYAAQLLRRGYLTCMEEKEMQLCRLATKLLSQGPGFLGNYSDEALHPVVKAVRHLNGEAELLRGVLRFSDLGGVLSAQIQPKNRVLPLLRPHFCARYPADAFFIYDRTHHEALFHTGERTFIRPLSDFQMAPPDDAEAACRLLWKRFFDTVAIRERSDPRRQMGRLPLRYRTHMTEFQPPAHFTPARSAAAVPAPGVPAGIPAPETPSAPGPSAPGSAP